MVNHGTSSFPASLLLPVPFLNLLPTPRRWIVWKLAATERRFPDKFPRGYLLADRVVRQLQYRCVTVSVLMFAFIGCCLQVKSRVALSCLTRRRYTEYHMLF